MKLTPERVQELLAAATPGPWTSERAIYSEDYLVTMDRRSEAYVTREPDAALIAAAPDLAADLLAARAELATERERREAAEAAVATLAKIVAARLPTAQRWLLEQVRRGTDMETPLHKSGEVKIAGLCSRGQTIAALVRAGLVEVGGFCAEIDGDGFTAREDATWYAITPAGRAALAGCP